MIEVLKQPQFGPLHVVDQVMIIFAGSKGFLDKVPVKAVQAWEEQFLRFMKEQMPEVRNKLMLEKKLTKDVEESLRKAIDAFQLQFKAP
jgi:F-type H+-transporting ATPase subunit alpha